nr:hypothetical protein [Tanacetum cinerariifolium]
GKHDEILSEMTNDDRMKTMDALGTICKSIQADNTNTHVTPCKVSHVDDSINLNVDDSTMPSDPIVQSVDINTVSTSYVGVAGAHDKDQPKVKVNSNFRLLVVDPVFDGVNISIPRKVVEKQWSMDTRLLKEELTRISLWVKLYDVPIQVFEEDSISLIATFIGKHVMLDSYTSSMCNDSCGRSSFARCLIEVNLDVDLVDVVTIGVPSLTGNDFTKETIRVEYEWRPPKCDICKIFDHVHDHCPKKVVSPPIVTTSNGVTPTVEKANDSFQTVMHKKKRANTGPSSKTNNIPTSNSYSALNVGEEDEEEVVENVYDESANLFTNTKTGGSSSFTVAADLGIQGLGLATVAIGKKLVVLVGVVETVPASSTRIG